MPEIGALRDLLTLFGLGVFAVVAVHRLKLPPVVGLLLTGVVSGPHGFGLIRNVHEVESLAEVGVVLLLFTVGLEYSLERLARLRRFLVLGGGLQVGVTLGATALVLRATGSTWPVAVFFGMLVALSSTAVVMRLLADRGELDSPHGGASLGILIFQDLCVVPLMLLVPILSGRESGFGEIAWVTGKAALVVTVALVSARLVVPFVLLLVVRTKSHEAFILTIILLCLGTAWVTAQFGLSLALGAFIAGLVISESPFSQRALGEILPFREVFNSLFFVSVGMLFDFRTLLDAPLAVAATLAAIVVGKTIVTGAVVVALGQPLRIAAMAGFSLAQVGEFSFVLSRVGLDAGLLDARLNQTFLAASVATMALTPALVALGPRAGAALERLFPRLALERHALSETNAPGGPALENHVIVVGYGLNGRNLTRVLANVDIPYVVIEANAETVRVERKKGVPIVYGDATREALLRHAGIARARVVVVAISDAAASRRVADTCRQANPRAHVIVRSRYVREVPSLLALGAHEVVPEEFETSIEIFARVLRRYLIPRDVIERCVAEIREGEYEILRALDLGAPPAEHLKPFLGGLALEVYRVSASSPVTGLSLAASGLKQKTGVTVVAIQRQDGTVVGNPGSGDEIRAEDSLLLIGRPEQLASAGKLFRPGADPDGSGTPA